MKTILAVVALLVVLLAVGSYFLFPEFLFDLAQRAGRYSAGLKKKEVRVAKDRIVYLEGGQGETVVLLHGGGANKDNWVPFAKWLTGNYRVVIPDLAGFGESTKRFDENYDIDGQVKRFDRFVEALHLKSIHLAGNSMGGLIAAVYAARFPEKINSLALLAPAGLHTVNKTEFVRQAEKDVNLTQINNADDLEKMISYLFVTPPAIPGVFKKVLAEQARAGKEFNAKVMKDMIEENLALEPFLSMIQAPVCIIWGDQDRILDVSGASVLEKGLKEHEAVILKQAGHIPMMEKPAETAVFYMNFLKKHRRN